MKNHKKLNNEYLFNGKYYIIIGKLMQQSDYINSEIDIAYGNIINSTTLLDNQKKDLLELIVFAKKIASGNKTTEESVSINSKSIAKMITIIINMAINFKERANVIFDEKCKSCEAHRYIEDVKKRNQIAEMRGKFGGYIPTDGPYIDRSEYGGVQPIEQQPTQQTQTTDKKEEKFVDIIKDILVKPYIYVFLSIISFSPFAVPIIEAISKLFK